MGRKMTVKMILSTLLFAVSLTFVESSFTKLTGVDDVRYSILEKKLNALVERVGTLENTIQNQNRIIGAQNEHIQSLEKTTRKQTLLLEAQSAQIEFLGKSIVKHGKAIEVLSLNRDKTDKASQFTDELGQGDHQTYNNNRTTESGGNTIHAKNELTGNTSGGHFIRRAVIHASATPPAHQAHSGRVAFTAYLDHVVDHLGIDHTIPFDKVLLNDGNGFNVHTGMFQCPRSGVYLFIFYIQSKTQEVEAKLVVDGNNKIDALTTGTGTGWEMGGNAALLYVNAGQNVWVATYYDNDVSLRNTDSYRYTSFSGMLLY